ncbi:MAG: hypothetical protein ACLQU5_32485 [Isosphaeraceae bacterium]|jgi:hypothetical protein
MGDFTQFQEPVWDRFFDFIFECDEDLNRAEVQEELRRRGIDVTRAVNKVQQALRTAKARAELEAARKSRLGLLARARGISLTDIGGSLEELKRRIAEQFQGQAQAAFFRKLEAAESKEDLQSLLEDAHLLDALSEDSDDVRAEAE